ncbi:MAG: hypothetical protein ACXWID_05455 [Pyrinomonadaceae bacterium]
MRESTSAPATVENGRDQPTLIKDPAGHDSCGFYRVTFDPLMKFSRPERRFNLAQLPIIVIETAFCFVQRSSFATGSSQFSKVSVCIVPLGQSGHNDF